MNEDKWLFTTDKLMPIEKIISNIEEYGYIDAYLGYADGFLVDSILYFLKENQQLRHIIDELQKIINKTYKCVEELEDDIENFHYYDLTRQAKRKILASLKGSDSNE